MEILLIKTFPLNLYDWEKVGIIDRELETFKSISKDKKIKFSIGTFGDNTELKFKNKCYPVKIIPFFNNKYFKNSYLIKLLHSFFLPLIFLNKFKKFDIIQSNQFWGSWILILCKLLLKKKIILRQGFDFYDFFIKKHPKSLFRFFLKIYVKFIYKYSDYLIVTSKSASSKIQKNFNIKKDKIFIIPNFVDTNKFKPIKLFEKKNKILCVGRLAKQKNYELLFNALKNSDYEVDIIGHGNIKNYSNNINSNNIKINFLGSVLNSNLPKIYNSYKTYILCSYYEGHPKTLLEAMACGINCIATNVEGIKELHNGHNFELVKLDSKTLRLKIDEIMKNKLEINYAAVKYIESNFSIPQIKNKYINFYQQINKLI